MNPDVTAAITAVPLTSPEATAAWIAAGTSIFTLIGTVIAQIIGFHSTKTNTKQQIQATHEDTAVTIAHQRERVDRTITQQNDHLDRMIAQQNDHLDRTIAQQDDQLKQTLAEERTRTLNERFATAAEELGSDKPAVRLAGVYAMAVLADDWKEKRQTCVDVLCGYLRMPYEPDPGEPQRLSFLAIREVRHTAIRVITAHLKEDAAESWQGLNFDFTGVVFDGGDFTDAQFSGGKIHFNNARFSDGDVYFTRAQFSGSTVDFAGAQFSGGMVHFTGAQFSGGEVRFLAARFSRGAAVLFYSAKFSGSTVNFLTAHFSGGKLDFSTARFSGGEVSDPDDWSSQPTFPWGTGTPPPSVKLPAREIKARGNERAP